MPKFHRKCGRNVMQDLEHRWPFRVAPRSSPAPVADRAPPGAVGEAVVSPGVGREVHFEPHSSIFLEGGAAAHVYQIARGCVMLSKLLPDGRRQVVEILGAGDVFGFSPESTYHCSAESLTATSCTSFARAALEHTPALMCRLSSHLHLQLCALHEHVTLLGRKSAMERVATFLMRCIPGRGGQDCPGPQHVDDGALVRLAMTRQEIADYLGLTIETVSRLLSKLKRRGLVSINKLDEITVRDVCLVCLMTGSHMTDGRLCESRGGLQPTRHPARARP